MNLPAHLVIVKGTEYFEKNRFVDYPLTDVLQMIGRAGRPGYSKQGVSVVMVAAEKKPFYKRFLYSPFPVESCLKKRMEVVINAEIASSTICSLSDAVGYLSWTYFFRRVKKNPSYYDAPLNAGDDNFQSYFIEVMKEALTNLEVYSCVKVDREYNDWVVTSTLLGCTASLFYLDYMTPLQMSSSMKNIVSSIIESSTNVTSVEQYPNPSGGPRDVEKNEALILNRIFMALSFTHEFDEFPLRHNEEELNERLYTSLKLDVTTKRLLHEQFVAAKTDAESFDMMGDPHVKCYLLVMAYLLRSPLPISDYVNDTKSLLDQLPRLVGAMQFISLNSTDSAGSFHLLCALSKVKQVLNSRSIDVDPLLQIPFLTKGSADILRMHGLSFLRLCKMESPALEKILSEVIFTVTELKKAVAFLQSVVIVTIDKTSIAQSAEKADNGNPFGLCIIELSISAVGGKSTFKVRSIDLNLVVCLGLPDGDGVLAHKSVFVSMSNEKASKFKKVIKLPFEWEKALTGADEEGYISLSMIREDVRGLDIAQRLSITKQK